MLDIISSTFTSTNLRKEFEIAKGNAAPTIKEPNVTGSKILITLVYESDNPYPKSKNDKQTDMKIFIPLET